MALSLRLFDSSKQNSLKIIKNTILGFKLNLVEQKSNFCSILNGKWKRGGNFEIFPTPVQGSTIGVGRVRKYASFYWRTHDFGHAHADTYAHFFPMIF